MSSTLKTFGNFMVSLTFMQVPRLDGQVLKKPYLSLHINSPSKSCFSAFDARYSRNDVMYKHTSTKTKRKNSLTAKVFESFRKADMTSPLTSYDVTRQWSYWFMTATTVRSSFNLNTANKWRHKASKWRHVTNRLTTLRARLASLERKRKQGSVRHVAS